MFKNFIRDTTSKMLRNAFWIITGFETASVGLLISFATARLDDHTPFFFNQADTHVFAIVMMYFGVLMTASFILDIKFWYLRTVFASVSTMFWSYITISFFLSDISSARGKIGVLTVFSFFIVIRIIVEARREPSARMKGEI